jgi:hypothetical protein
MLKLLLVLFGAGGGAAGAASWLLSQPETPSEPVIPASGDGIKERVDLVRARLLQAVAEGRLAGEQTEVQLKQQLEAYRKGAVS